MIILYQFPRALRLPSYSPFCMKLETFLRMARLEYDNRFVLNPGKSPRGKLPYIKIDDKSYYDSGLIINMLMKTRNLPIDAHLNEHQKAMTAMLNAVMNDSLYWINHYFRWQDEEGWDITNQLMFRRGSWFQRNVIVRLVRRRMLADLHAQGIGRLSYAEVLGMGVGIIEALGDILGENPYFLGKEPHSVDATVFSFLANILWFPIANQIQKSIRSHSNLMHYCHRMWSEYYPELPMP